MSTSVQDRAAGVLRAIVKYYSGRDRDLTEVGRRLEMNSLHKSPINFLYTNIGRGHPFYLDGILECLPRESVGHVTDVFGATSGSARQAWRLARFVYRGAARGGMYSKVYSRMRGGNDFNRGGLMQAVMGRPLRKAYADDHAPLVVAHPLLVAILKDKRNLIYQHGEVAAPRESWVKGGHLVLVPLPQTADEFISRGFAKERLFVSGLCIEPALVKEAEGAFSARLERLSSSESLCGAFISSGAEPREHVAGLCAAALSAVAAGGRALIFARRSGSLAAEASREFAEKRQTLESVRTPSDLPGGMSRSLLCLYDERWELDEFTAKLFAELDYFVSPSHERTNWALSLGLPMFVVDPALGSFSPLNRQVLLDYSVARVIPDRSEAALFGATLTTLKRNGELRRMAEVCWGRFDMGGFENIAEMLQSV